MILLLALLGCSPDDFHPRSGTWARIPSPNGYTDVDCFVWDGQASVYYNGPGSGATSSATR